MFGDFFFKIVTFMIERVEIQYSWTCHRRQLWFMRIARWIPKATNTHSEYVLHMTFPLLQWLQDCTSVLGYAYIACIVE